MTDGLQYGLQYMELGDLWAFTLPSAFYLQNSVFEYDERTRATDLLITSVRSVVADVAHACKSRIGKGFSILSIAHYCRALHPG